MDISARLRYYHFIAGLLANQQHDPLCSACKAFTNSVRDVRGGADEFMQAHAADMPGLPKENAMVADINRMIAELTPLQDAVGQKKAGNCSLPEGVCFVKSSKALIDRISS
ncbi:MAG: hypothetical protein HZA15_05000 [Nitrospirae bacterium]|nr:hypothetical protein [Nitrospirota bacterium]